MALFKSFRGGEENLTNVPLHDGYVYFCTDTENLFFDHKSTNSDTVIRSQLNANVAKKLKYTKDGTEVEITAEMIDTHMNNTDIHVTASEKETWDNKADSSTLTTHTGDTTVHITADERTKWNSASDAAKNILTNINDHNTSTSAHSDIRGLISDLTTKLNTLADSDDTTLDQLSEIVAYIKNNKSLIDGITTSKVSISDIINTLTSTETQKPLSAAQGKALKDLIDALQTAVDGKAASDHNHDSSYLKLSGGTVSGATTFTDSVINNGLELFNNCYLKKKFAVMSAGTAYANLDSQYKDGTYHRMWRLRFPSNSNFWGKIKITLFGTYSSFNASGIMSKSITCNFNAGNIYNNVGYYGDLGLNVENDYRISEAIWNADVNSWEILIWQEHLNGNNNCSIMLEAWATSSQYIEILKNTTLQEVELTQDTSYTAPKANYDGSTKTENWLTKPTFQNPYGRTLVEDITLTEHTGNTNIHVTAAEKAKWNASSVRGTVTVSADGTSTINIPITITDTNALSVYYRGLLLTPATHYTATTSAITLVGFTANKGEIFTFVGTTATGTSLNATAAQVTFSDTTTDKVFDGCSTVQEALVKVPEINKAGVTIYYGTCDTSASTAAKVATTVDSNFVLKTGATVLVKFTNNNTASSPTLDIDGTGAKSIMMYGTTATYTYMWAAGEIVQLTYDGTNWIMDQVSPATTNTYGVTKLVNSTSNTSTTLAATASSVKTAYDKAVSAYTKADDASTKVTALTTSVEEAKTSADSALEKVSSHTHSNYIDKSGDTMTGALIAKSSGTGKQVRNIFLSTSEPTSSDGEDGDIWLIYEA